MSRHDIYSETYVRSLFDEMSRTYGYTNIISSFGFNARWRSRCVRQIPIAPSTVVCDMMSGTGECWRPITAALGPEGTIVALDFSAAMCRGARTRRTSYPHTSIEVLEEDGLNSSLPDSSVDSIVSVFGLKTFNDVQQRAFAREMARILKPGGFLSLLEISVPSATLLRVPYMFYLKRVIPVVGRLLLGNPDNYRMLGVYTERFGDCRRMEEHVRDAGLEATPSRYFFGCATGVWGQKPAA